MVRPIIKIEVRGLREMGENFKLLTEDLQKKSAVAAVRKAAKMVAEKARTNHPGWENDTGALEGAIGARRLTKTSYPGLEVWAAGVFNTAVVKKYVNNVRNRRKGLASWNSAQTKTYEAEGPQFYWKFLEYGTVKMEAKPFLNPALANNTQRAITVMQDELSDQIRKSLRKMKETV